MAWDAAFDGSLGERLADYEDPADLDGRVAEPATGLVSLGFLWAALGRTVRLWCTLGVLGLVIGAGYYVTLPPVILGDDIPPAGGRLQPEPASEVATELALAQSIPVATAVVRQLGLPQTPESFLGSYTVSTASPTSGQILKITANGATSDKAVQIAQAIAQQLPRLTAPPTSGPSTTC